MKIEARNLYSSKHGHVIALSARGAYIDLVPGIPDEALGDAIAHLWDCIGGKGDAAAFEADCRAAVAGVGVPA